MPCTNSSVLKKLATKIEETKNKFFMYHLKFTIFWYFYNMSYEYLNIIILVRRFTQTKKS